MVPLSLNPLSVKDLEPFHSARRSIAHLYSSQMSLALAIDFSSFDQSKMLYVSLFA